jgi:hypothetical protein
MPGSDGVTIKLKAKYRFHMTTMLFFIFFKNYHNKFSEVESGNKISGFYIRQCWCVPPQGFTLLPGFSKIVGDKN